jgi:hypothetical protein
MRTKGSCQFDPYYKIERWDERMMVWKPIQKAFSNQGSAELFAAGTGYIKCRVIKMTKAGTEIVKP